MVLALGPAAIVAAPPAQAYTPSPATRAAYQARVIQQINVIRLRSGRHSVTPSYCPTWFAAHWAWHLASTWTFYHQSMYPILGVCRANVAAENLARGNVSADAIVAAWMASPGHRANILDGRLNRIGVAAYYTRGQWVVAADFTRS
jgi:uncharacterized protein YkwD